MKKYIIVLFLILGIHTHAQQPVLSNENAVSSRSFQKEVKNPDIDVIEGRDVIEQVTYFDGLGRAKQRIAIRQSSNKKDIVTHIIYDALGRKSREYLPFETDGTIGSLRTGDLDEKTRMFYYNLFPDDFVDVTSANPYTEMEFENSPLNRVLKQGAPGEDWKLGSGHEIRTIYDTNIDEEVRRFHVELTSDYTPTLVLDGNYNSGELYKTITKDENWTSGKLNTIEEFTDKNERVLLKRNYAKIDGAVIAHDTYYVYDYYGNLTYTIPSKVDFTNGVSDIELAELCYQYRYDSRNRLVEKKIPGKGWECIAYNKLDQPIMSQDKRLKIAKQWLFSVYDAYGRVAYTGMDRGNAKSRTEIQTLADATGKQYVTKTATPNTYAGTTIYYTKDAYPGSFDAIHTINYYDDYVFDTDGITLPTTVYGEPVSTQTKTLSTGNKVLVLGTNKWITTLFGYDKKGRVIWSATKNNYLQTLDIAEMKLDFVGKVVETKATHTKGSNVPIVTIEKFTYDHLGRVIKQTHKVNDQEEEVIAQHTYDAIGQLTQKKVGEGITTAIGIEGLQNLDYQYNVRGWLKGINDVDNLGADLFGFRLHYNNPTTGTALYNGNISQQYWRSANTDNSLKNYAYSYDALNRLTGAVDNTGRYTVSGITYDRMGNILSFQRNGLQNGGVFNDMDQLTYSYDSGNKLLQVTDHGNKAYGFKDGTNINDDDFEYDDNGNMIIDRNSGITDIKYNYLNLPYQVTINGKMISYVYGANGVKQLKAVGNIYTNYAGNFIYENGKLQFFNHPEGYIEPTITSTGVEKYEYTYQYRDHLDNIRLSYADSDKDGIVTQTEIKEENNYYPYGLKHQGYNNVVAGRNHKFGFGGKEEQDEFGIEWIDITARNYNPALARWMNIDPLAEQMRRHSPYNYAFNNPIFFMDPDGMAPVGGYGESLETAEYYHINYESISNKDKCPSGDCETLPLPSDAFIAATFDRQAIREGIDDKLIEMTGKHIGDTSRGYNFVEGDARDYVNLISVSKSEGGGALATGKLYDFHGTPENVIISIDHRLIENGSEHLADIIIAGDNYERRLSWETTNENSTNINPKLGPVNLSKTGKFTNTQIQSFTSSLSSKETLKYVYNASIETTVNVSILYKGVWDSAANFTPSKSRSFKLKTFGSFRSRNRMRDSKGNLIK
ncbi:DUF6443 domain-containing protein [Aquimarina mytili]|uniref:Type IV secretion protein Rhs n=1 Tax=Aquimarina mytili TaxID=874423 RepID=A0A936ZVI5_9FLAO|nr:DUF6443 domain-containing protein [Aquimarina mytili]MBL0685443.1 type IV secretion protein Rhs [Aquimarina mytili]